MSKSLFDQFNQIRGTRTFFDDMYLQYAEEAGRYYLTSNLATVSGSNIVSDTVNNFEGDELNNFVVIETGDAAGVYRITACSGTSQAYVTPSVVGTESSVSYRRHYYQNLEDDLNYIREMLQRITGESNWYDAPDNSLNNIGGDIFKNITNITDTITASGSNDTLTLVGEGSISVDIDSVSKIVTISGSTTDYFIRDLSYNIGTWEYNGGFTSVADNLQVYYNGVLNKANDSEYYTASISSGVLQIDFAFNTYSDDWVTCTYGQTGGSQGLKPWVVRTTSGNVINKDRIIVDTSAVSAYTLTLPSNPSMGDEIWFVDGGGNCSTIYVTIARNGNNIMGAASDLDIDQDNAAFSLVYYNSTRGWIIFD
jgi:hypothetical protein